MRAVITRNVEHEITVKLTEGGNRNGNRPSMSHGSQ
jgi:hypothetical protein